MPSEDDAELVVNFGNDSLSGVWNNIDATDPNTNMLFDQNQPGTTKLVDDFIDDLIDGQVYLAVHTAGQGGNVAIRGQAIAVPEPSGVAAVALSLVAFLSRRRRTL